MGSTAGRSTETSENAETPAARTVQQRTRTSTGQADIPGSGQAPTQGPEDKGRRVRGLHEGDAGPAVVSGWVSHYPVLHYCVQYVTVFHYLHTITVQYCKLRYSTVSYGTVL